MRISHLCLIGVAAVSVSFPGYSMNPGQKHIYNKAVGLAKSLLANTDYLASLAGFVDQNARVNDSVGVISRSLEGMGPVDGAEDNFTPCEVPIDYSTFGDLLANKQNHAIVGSMLMTSANKFFDLGDDTSYVCGLLAARLGAILLDHAFSIRGEPNEFAIAWLLNYSGFVVNNFEITQQAEDVASAKALYNGFRLVGGLNTALQQIKQQQEQQQWVVVPPTPSTNQQQPPMAPTAVNQPQMQMMPTVATQQQQQQNVGAQPHQTVFGQLWDGMVREIKQRESQQLQQPQMAPMPLNQQPQPAARTTSSTQAQQRQPASQTKYGKIPEGFLGKKK